MSPNDHEHGSDGATLEMREGYAILTLDRPAKANAMDRRARQTILALLAGLERDCKVVVVTGAGRHFCAGVDLAERDADVARGDDSAFAEWTEVCLAVRRHHAVFIAAVNGTALGGGFTLVSCCDLAIASEGARFGLPELSFGAYPALSGPSAQLTISRKRAAWMILNAEPITAAQAEQWGVVNRVTPAGELIPVAEGLAERIAGFDQRALTAAKRALDVVPGAISTWEQAFDHGHLVHAGIQAKSL